MVFHHQTFSQWSFFMVVPVNSKTSVAITVGSKGSLGYNRYLHLSFLDIIYLYSIRLHFICDWYEDIFFKTIWQLEYFSLKSWTDCLCLPICSGIVCDHYPWCIRPQCTGSPSVNDCIPLCTMPQPTTQVWIRGGGGLGAQAPSLTIGFEAPKLSTFGPYLIFP